MFGYIKPHDPYLYKKDDVLYKSLYCGVCKAIGSTCGQTARMTLTYDIAFLAAFAHNLMGKDVEIKQSHCVIHPITKRPIAKRDEIFDKLALVNVILARHKIIDDTLDSKKGYLKKAFFHRGYKKAKRKFPEIDRIVLTSYNELRSLENANNGLIDEVSEKFGNMLAMISDEVFGEYKSQNTHDLFFYLGKWIYVIDAIDDYDKDKKKGEYNPFLARYGEDSAQTLIKKHGDDLDFMFADIFNGIKDNFYKIKFGFNRDLLENVLFKGIPMKTKSVIQSKLCEKTKGCGKN